MLRKLGMVHLQKFPQRYKSNIKLPSHRTGALLTLWYHAKVFFKKKEPIYIPTSCMTFLSLTSPIFDTDRFLIFDNLGCETHISLWFKFIFPWKLKRLRHIFICLLTIQFCYCETCLFKSFIHFSGRLLCWGPQDNPHI